VTYLQAVLRLLVVDGYDNAKCGLGKYVR
jgi:hypothetical protein